MRKKIVFVLGPTACGKGTQCQLSVKNMNLFHLSAGELLREEIQNKGPKAELIQNIINNGTIVPVEITLGLIKNRIENSGCDKIIIDGFPRNQDNYDGWLKIMKDDYDVRGIVYMTCPEEIIRERMRKRSEIENRSDDTDEIFAKRMNTFHNETYPIIKLYESMGLVKELDGNRSVDIIYKDMENILTGFYN